MISAQQVQENIEKDLNEAEAKAIDALSRYKFQMFGYWAAIWVHLNRCGAFNRPNPFRNYVQLAKEQTTGKHKAGRELDGRTWDEYPQSK